MTLAQKQHPDRFSAMSGRMAAIVADILGESWTDPAIEALSVTSDGFVTTASEFLGEATDLDRNLLNLLIAAGLDQDERAEFERRYRERIDDWRPVLSGPSPASGRLTRPDFGMAPVQCPSTGRRRSQSGPRPSAPSPHAHLRGAGSVLIDQSARRLNQAC